MLSDLYPDLNFPEEGPEFEVWTQIESGLDLARTELYALGPMERALVEAVAKVFGEVVEKFVASSADRAVYENLLPFLQDPWVRYAVDVALARAVVGRASGALDRYRDLAPVFVGRDLSERQRRYLTEALGTYLLGFDAACISFSAATSEQLLLSYCETKRLIPPVRPDQRTPSFSTMMSKAAATMGEKGTAAARRLAGHRDQVMHRSIWDESFLRSVARRSVEDLTIVVYELDSRP